MNKKPKSNSQLMSFNLLDQPINIGILIIIFMEITVKKHVSDSPEQQTTIDPPSTPKKKPKYEANDHTTERRVKKFTQMKEKESVSLIYILLVFIWVVAIAFTLFMAVQTKLRGAEAQADKEISQCKMDFDNNRCHSPVKGLINYCNEKVVCLQQTPVERVGKSLSYSRVLGEVINEFAQGAGLVGLMVGLVLIGLCLRQKGKEKQTVSVEFFQ